MPDRTITTSTGTTVTLAERLGDTVILLDHPNAPAHMRNTEAGRIIDGSFQPAIFAAWSMQPEALRAIADLIDQPERVDATVLAAAATVDVPEPSFNERNTLATGRSACRSCSAPVAWFVTPTGKRQPVDPVPTESGNVVVDGDTATVLSADALAELDVWTPRYTSHFATCPDAADWRSKAGAR